MRANITHRAGPLLRQPAGVTVERGLAIREAVSVMAPGDVLIVAGKGHEDYQILGENRIPFDDRNHVAEALRLRDKERR